MTIRAGTTRHALDARREIRREIRIVFSLAILGYSGLMENPTSCLRFWL
jgi:hypothetical protein